MLLVDHDLEFCVVPAVFPDAAHPFDQGPPSGSQSLAQKAKTKYKMV